MGKKHKKRNRVPSTRTRGSRKSWAFLAIVVVTLGLTVWLLLPIFSLVFSGGDRTVLEVKASMGGFSPEVLRAKVGQTLTVRLKSLDTRFHTDGGGKHQLAVDELRLNIIAPPLGTSKATFTPTSPGVYYFYCDICCGGRQNPAMQGKLIVEA